MKIKYIKNKYGKQIIIFILFSLLSFNVFAQEVSTSSEVLTEPLSDVLIVENSTPTEATTTNPVDEFIFSGTTTSATTTEIFTPALDDNQTGTTTEATTSLPTGTTTIETGDAVALANVINVVNTNLINSTGTIILENLINGANQDLDFRPVITNSETTTSSTTTTICALLSCNGVSTTTVEIIATSTISNNINLDALSGQNTVETVEKANINTGDTLAGLNLINVANTNIIDSNYLLISLNSFNDINGNIILPALTNFTSDTSAKDNPAINNLNINQTSDLQNNLDVTANSGGNNIAESANATTNSGSSNSVTNVYNSINNFLVGGNSISILLRVTGDWIGNLIGLPEEATFVQDGNVRILNYTNTSNNILNLPANILSVNSTNTSSISNNLKVKADSGNNKILNTEDANINTGNSLAAANVINIANTNIINRNWILVIINIFGNLNGNIVFASPKVNNVIVPVSDIATTTGVDTIISTTTIFSSSISGTSVGGNSSVGGNYDVTISQIATTSTYNFLSLQQDEDTNIKKIELEKNITEKSERAQVSVIRTMAGNKQELKIKNLTNYPILNSEFEDILYDPSGQELKREKWDLGEILGDEEITLTYDVIFSNNAKSGTYSFGSILNYALDSKLVVIEFKQNGTLTYENVPKTVTEQASVNTTISPSQIVGTDLAVASEQLDIIPNKDNKKQNNTLMYSIFSFILLTFSYFFVRTALL